MSRRRSRLVRGAAWVSAWDRRFGLRLRIIPTSRVFGPLRALGVAGSVAPPVLLVLLLARLFRGGYRRDTTLLATVLLGTTGTAVLLRGLIRRERPTHWRSPIPGSAHSFPSGHAASSLALAIILAQLVPRGRSRWLAGGLGGGFVLGSGYARVALGLHHPSDVAGGWGVALLWVGMAVLGRR